MTDKNNLEKRDDDICEIMDPHEDVIESLLKPQFVNKDTAFRNAEPACLIEVV